MPEHPSLIPVEIPSVGTPARRALIDALRDAARAKPSYPLSVHYDPKINQLVFRASVGDPPHGSETDQWLSPETLGGMFRLTRPQLCFVLAREGDPVSGRVTAAHVMEAN